MNVTIQGTPCHDLQEASRREWLDTNGLGGYASTTVTGLHTRKYHGLLVASLAEPAGRFVLLSALDETIVTNGREQALACHRYPGALHPAGHELLREFRIEEGPVSVYAIGNRLLTRRLLMVQGSNTTLLRYELSGGKTPVHLRLAPLLAFRRHHELKRADTCIRTQPDPVANGIRLTPYDGMPPLLLQASVPVRFATDPCWYYNFEYQAEAERGYDHHEDLFCPGPLELTLPPGRPVIVAASTDAAPADLEAVWDRELASRRDARAAAASVAAAAPAAIPPSELADLIVSGRRFLTRTPGDGRATIIAGYPWFDDWGRDTLISLPGLTFHSGRPDLGVEILKAVGPHERDGLLPNCFAANPAQHAYNSVDAALWYFRAVQAMLAHTGDAGTVRAHFWPVMKRIVSRFIGGTHHRIFMATDGLLHAGGPHTQLTWMDATSHGEPVTPRHGYAVDINALWYNALSFTAELAARFAETLPWPADLPARCADAFRRCFWLEDAGYLADACHEGEQDRALRPNQLLAVALPHSPLTPAQQRSVVDAVRRDLLTPYGLRTLSPRDPAYRGRYEGDQPTRDARYHQGTVWPWLLGPYGEALMRVSDDPAAAAAELAATIRPLLDHVLHGSGLYGVPEIFDGDAPQRPNGCPAQAWSTAELIRVFNSLPGLPHLPSHVQAATDLRPT